MDKAKNIIVLGASGFVGSSIVEAISQDASCAVKGLSSRDLDLTNNTLVHSTLPALIKDSILVMTAAVTRDKDSSINAMVRNIKMDSNVAEVLKKYLPQHVVYISSVDVYGRENLTLPLSENSKFQPSNYYAISRMCGEFIFKTACAENNIPLTVLRLTALYGPGDTHNSPIKTFISNALQGKPVKVRGNGSERRDFLYIKDVGIVTKLVIQNGISGIYNVVTNNSHQINDVLAIIQELYGQPFNILYEGDNKNSDLVFSKSALLEAFPTLKFTEFESGLRETYERFILYSTSDSADLAGWATSCCHKA